MMPMKQQLPSNQVALSKVNKEGRVDQRIPTVLRTPEWLNMRVTRKLYLQKILNILTLRKEGPPKADPRARVNLTLFQVFHKIPNSSLKLVKISLHHIIAKSRIKLLR